MTRTNPIEPGRILNHQLRTEATDHVFDRLPVSRPVSLMDAGAFQCRAILGGNGAETMFCGADTCGSRLTYCADHLAIVIGKGTESERTVGRELLFLTERRAA
ncbi:hypothetical protein DYI37_03285 [Fulvimarina endophytica]|uniref:Uncharacterized protein n=1 Tax=Fulvimarina endophytica TaxID=2293836 RepID=A0A371XB89_9HYPH|nr:hypothetical protein [Fulvimarina endophytica]RFC66479.1 hypothetical protein DYI37_03285 [Fulvimarina endophytica]